MSHKIAIIKTKDVYYNHGDDCDTIISSITEWTVVTDDEYSLLQKAAAKMPYGEQFQIFEQPVDTKVFIAKTIADYIELVKQAEVKEAEDKKKRAAQALARKHKNELKDRESKLALLNKLKAELGQW